jgi:hypothetical protein
VAPVLLVQELDDIVPKFVLKVNVDVRRLVALPADEALKEHLALFWGDGGDAQAVAHGRVGDGPSAARGQ